MSDVSLLWPDYYTQTAQQVRVHLFTWDPTQMPGIYGYKNEVGIDEWETATFLNDLSTRHC